MTDAIVPLTRRPAWEALEAHYSEAPRHASADALRRGPRAGRAARRSRRSASTSTTRRTASPTRRSRSSCNWPKQSGLRARIDAMFRGEKINVTENRAVLHVALRAPKGESILVDGEDVVPEVHAVLDRMADFSDRVRGGAVDGPHRQAHPQRRQHRHRRLRPRPGDGLRGAAALQRPRPDVPLRLQRRRHRLRRGHARPRPRRDAVHHLARRRSRRWRR